MLSDSSWGLPLAGLACGTLMGVIARNYRFCTLSALERHWYAGDSSSLRTWVLAATVALVVTQTMSLNGMVELSSSFYLSTSFNLLGSIVGGLMFGFGMALVGTCGFGALIRLGGGSLQSLMVITVIGLTALSTQRGSLGEFRQVLHQKFSIDLGWAESQSLGDIATALTNGVPMQTLTAVLVALLLLSWIFSDRQYRQKTSGILTATGIGLCIAFGWFITSTYQQTLFEPVQLEAGSFVLPPGELIFQFIAATGTIPDYGVGLVVGVVVGSAISAIFKHDVHWEACDDAGELGRHLGGACLMGVGGVFAAGCTIGQGVAAASVMALSAPIVFASIVLGARFGLAYLLEGSLLFFRRAK